MMQLTEEQRKSLIEHAKYLQSVRGGTAQTRSLIEIALAALTARPVGTIRIEMDWNTHRNVATIDMRPDLVLADMKDGDELFTRPAPAINLAELVPDELYPDPGCEFDYYHCEGFNLCRAAILRNIEEQSK